MRPIWRRIAVRPSRKASVPVCGWVRYAPSHERDHDRIRGRSTAKDLACAALASKPRCGSSFDRPDLPADLHRLPRRNRRSPYPLRPLLGRGEVHRAALLRASRHAVRGRSRHPAAVAGRDRRTAGLRARPGGRPLRRGRPWPRPPAEYGDRLELARALGGMMVRAGAELLAGTDVIVPAPLHLWRLWRRRFNQAMALAAVISRTSAIPCDPSALARVKSTRPQVGLTKAQRGENLQGAFR